MQNKINKMIETINNEIAIAKIYFDMHHENNQKSISKIQGMIEMLEIITNEKWAFNENGLYKK